MDGEASKPSKWSLIMSKITNITADPSNNNGEFQPHEIPVAVYLADLHKKYPLDKPPSSTRFPNEHYISYISELIDKRDFKTAAIFPQLELFGFDGVVNNKIFWTKYIGYVIRRYGKKRTYIWKPFIRKLIVLIEEKIIGLRSCLDEPIVFTTFFKLGLDSLEKWKYEAKLAYEPKSWLELIITSGTLYSYDQLQLIRFLRKNDEKYIPIDSYAVELVIRYCKYRIFKEWVQLVDMSTLQFEKGANILHIILTHVHKQQYTPFIDRFKDKLLQSDNTGITPAELILRKPSLLRIPKIAELFSTIGSNDNADVHYLKLKKQFALYRYSKVVGPAWKFRFAVEAFFDPEDNSNALNYKNTWFKDVTRSDNPIAKDLPLLELPRDILYTIIEHISLSTALALTMVSKRVHQYFRSDPAFSRRIVQLTRPLIYKQQISKEDIQWDYLLKDHFSLECQWNSSRPKSTKIMPIYYRDLINVEAMDDNYIAYSINRRRSIVLWSFATQQNVHWYNSNINTLTKAEPRLFYSSLFGQEPALITMEPNNLAIYRNGAKILQNTGTTLGYLSAIGVDDKSVYIENSNILWDIEAAKISSTLNVIDKLSNIRSVTIPAVYNSSSKLLVTSSMYNEKLFFVDLRAGKSIRTMNALPTSMGFMDDHLMAITTPSSILKLDLRNFQQHKILSDDLHDVAPLMDAPNGRLILGTNSMHGYMCWDLRDEKWRKMTFGSFDEDQFAFSRWSRQVQFSH